MIRLDRAHAGLEQRGLDCVRRPRISFGYAPPDATSRPPSAESSASVRAHRPPFVRRQAPPIRLSTARIKTSAPHGVRIRALIRPGRLDDYCKSTRTDGTRRRAAANRADSPLVGRPLEGMQTGRGTRRTPVASGPRAQVIGGGMNGRATAGMCRPRRRSRDRCSGRSGTAPPKCAARTVSSTIRWRSTWSSEIDYDFAGNLRAGPPSSHPIRARVCDPTSGSTD